MITANMNPMAIFKRSNKGWIAGVCSGLAKQMDIPVWLVRVSWLIGIMFVIPFLFYFVCALSLPREDRVEEFYKPKFFGVCYDLSKISNVELSFLRLVACSLILVSGGTVFLIYIILRFVITRQPVS